MRSVVPDAHPIASAEIVDNIATALGLAAQGLTATPAPAYVGVVARPLGLIMRRITQPETVREVCLYRPAWRSIPPAAESFGEFLKHWIRKWSVGANRAETKSRRFARKRKNSQ